MRSSWLVVLAGCGRFSFDATDDGGIARDVATDTATDTMIDASEPNLVYHFALDGDRTDALGGPPLTCRTGCPTYGPGPRGMSALFDGGACLEIPDATVHRAPTFTIAAWADPSAGQAGNVTSRPFQSATTSQNTREMFIDVDDWIFSVNSVQQFMTLGAGTFHHMALTFDGQQFSSFLDGVLVGVPVMVGPALYNAEPELVGCDIDDGAVFSQFKGYIDDVRFYDRALSVDEIAALATP